jgi:hypothetical protein
MILYVGPGMSGGVIALIIALILSFFTFLFAVFFYPIKKAIKFIKKLFKR